MTNTSQLLQTNRPLPSVKISETYVLGGFKLTKWISNSLAVLASIPDKHKAKQIWPVKDQPLPRQGILKTLAARMDMLLSSELEAKLKPSVFLDRQWVLKYIRNERRFNTYVANRTILIRNLSHKDQWGFIGSKENPTDLCYCSFYYDKSFW